MNTALLWALAHPETVAIVVAGVASALSAVAEAAGWRKTSKVLGTFTFDAGRVVRYGKLLLAARDALQGKP